MARLGGDVELWTLASYIIVISLRYPKIYISLLDIACSRCELVILGHVCLPATLSTQVALGINSAWLRICYKASCKMQLSLMHIC